MFAQTFEMIKKNFLAIFVAAIILFLSLSKPDNFDKVPIFHFQGMDKVAHLLMYFGLMGTIIFEHRKTLKKWKQLFITALIPAAYGLLMELLQMWCTISRTGSVADFLFDILGVIFAIVAWMSVISFRKEKIR
jgi:VanZ family protein